VPEPASPNEIVARLLARHPAAPRILLNHGMHCMGCAIAPFETLADACAAYDIPVAQLLEELDRARRPARKGSAS
jgi:hybrid cluster-associated redox disulfide protein